MTHGAAYNEREERNAARREKRAMERRQRQLAEYKDDAETLLSAIDALHSIYRINGDAEHGPLDSMAQARVMVCIDLLARVVGDIS